MTEIQKKTERLLKRPTMNKGSLDINVQRIFTDVNGVIISKNDAQVPANMKTKYPVYVFGEFDRKGGYVEAQKTLPPDAATKFLFTGVWGVGSNPYFMGGGLSNLNNLIQTGDIFTVYTDSLQAPTIYVFIVLTLDLKSLASVVENAVTENAKKEWGKINIENVRYYADNKKQWQAQIQTMFLSYLSAFAGNHFVPQTYRTPYTIADDFALVGLEFVLTQYVGLQFYYLFETDSIQLTFNLLVQ